jgi:hypothetical protein
VSAAIDESFEVYAASDLVDHEAQQEAQRRVLAWRAIRYIASMQAKDLEAERDELVTMLERSFEAEQAALGAVIERARQEILR